MTKKIYYIDETLIEIEKIFEEINIYALLFSLRHVIHNPSFRMVNLQCCGDHFSNILFIDAKTK